MKAKLVVAALFAAAYAAIGLVRHWHFGSSGYDLGIFDQVLWHLSRFEVPATTIHGLSNYFGDHFSPIWILAAPLYWIHAAPETLIVLQAVLVAASILPVWAFLERRLPKKEAAFLVIAYALFWGLQRGVQFDVHELAFAAPLIAWMVLEIDKRSLRYLVPAFLLCFVKEDQIPLVVAAAAFVAWRSSGRARVLAAGVAAVAFAWFVLVVKVIIPALSDANVYAIGSAFNGVTADPMAFIPNIFNPTKLNTVLMWLLPFAFLPLISTYSLLLVPLILERFLSASPNHWGASFHYTMPLAPILAMAAGDGLSKIKNRRTWIAAVCILLSAFLPGRQPIWKLFSPGFYQAVPFEGVAERALAEIPDGASVVAQDFIVPHLSQRELIYTLRIEGSGADATPDFVIAAPDAGSSWPLANATAVRARLDQYLALGYTRRFDNDGWVVLSK